MSTELLECVEQGPEDGASASIIWLHGLGADGYDFLGIVPAIVAPDDRPWRFVFPHAPVRPVTINGGVRMRAWYDIRRLDLRQEEDEEGMRESQEHVEALVAREVERGIPSQRIVLAGFSQGGAIAIQTGVRHPRRLAGVLALSTYLTLPARLEEEASGACTGLPIFMAHGAWDPIVPIDAAKLSKDALVRSGFDVEWHEYSMDHSVHPDEVVAIGEWLRRVLAD